LIAKTLVHHQHRSRPPRVTAPTTESTPHSFPFPHHTGEYPEHFDDARREETWLALLDASRRSHPQRFRYYLRCKRGFDIAVAAMAIVAFSPVFALAALAIWSESRGPIIFRQTRIGKDGKIFTMYKFTTMISDRRRTLRSYYGPERRVTHKTKTDPRVTRVGKFLRRTSIDELPQLFNVLRGEMSLVGPRPELPQIVERYAPWQHLRHRVQPGMTGWWQVQGRSDLPMHEHTELDLYYVVHQSFTLDLRILFHTTRAVLRRSGAF